MDEGVCMSCESRSVEFGGGCRIYAFFFREPRRIVSSSFGVA